MSAAARRQAQSTSLRPLQLLLPLSLLLPVLALAWLSGRWWWSERLLLQLDLQVSSLEQRRVAPDRYGPLLSIPAWQELDAATRAAIALRPASAAGWQTLARVQQLRTVAPPRPANAPEPADLQSLFAPWREAQAEALQALREAAARQPQSSQQQVLLAARKASLGQLDEELLLTLQRADALAPHFGGTQRNLTQLLATLLPLLDAAAAAPAPDMAGSDGAAARRALLDFARRYLTRVLAADAAMPTTLLGSLRQSGALPLVCPLLDIPRLHEAVAAACR